MNAKIRNAQNQKIPYMLILGENEKEHDSVSIRPRQGKQRNNVPLNEFITFIKDKIAKQELL